MVKGPVSPPPVWPVPMAPDQLLVSSHCSYSQQWFRTCFPNLSPFIHIYIYSFIQFMVEIQEKIQQSFHLGSKFIRTPGTFQHAMLRGNGTRGLIVEELKLFLENHHVYWVNRLAMVIFESYVGLPEDILNVGQGLIYCCCCCCHRRFTIGNKHYQLLRWWNDLIHGSRWFKYTDMYIYIYI